MITHWPNESSDAPGNTEHLRTYDENLFFNSIKKMQSLADQKSLFVVDQNLKYEKKVAHWPLFFTTKERGFKRLEVVPNGGVDYNKFSTTNKKRKSILNDRHITYTLPKGRKIEIRPTHYRWLRGASEVQFELGFTLSGPMAFNIQELNTEEDSLLN